MKAWLTAAALLLASPAFAQDNPLLPSETWNDLRESVVGLTEEPRWVWTRRSVPMTRPSCRSG